MPVGAVGAVGAGRRLPVPAPSALSPSYRSLRFSQCPPHLDATLSHRRFNYTLLSTARGPYATASTRDTVAGCHPPRPFRTPWRHRATARYPRGSKRAKATQRHPGVNGGHACSGPHHGRVIKLRSGRSIGQFQQRSGHPQAWWTGCAASPTAGLFGLPRVSVSDASARKKKCTKECADAAGRTPNEGEFVANVATRV